MAGRTPQTDTRFGPKTLTVVEEEAVVQYILKRDARGFSPRRADVEDMANLLLAKHGIRRIGKCWTDCFIAQRPELRTHFSCVYDYQRALQEDPDALIRWFCLVENIHAKYNIVDSDFYNFDEMGFVIGMIQVLGALLWGK